MIEILSEGTKWLTTPFGFLCWSAATGLVGFFGGHHLAVHREKRSEFNSAADVFFQAIKKDRDAISHNVCEVIDASKSFRRHLNKSQLIKFDQLIISYEEARERGTEFSADGCFYFLNNKEEIEKLLDEISGYANRK